MSLESEIKEILDLNVKGSSTHSEANEKLRELQGRIRNGESTGDKIRDFVIANLGTLSPETEKPYREIEVRLKDKAGSQILIVEQDETIHGCPGIIPRKYIDSMFIGIDTTLKLGVLASGDLKLDVNKGKIIFPTNNYVRRYDRISILDSKWTLEDGPINLNWYEIMDLGKRVQRRETPMPNDGSGRWEHGLFIHVGGEVEHYFSRTEDLFSYECLDTTYVKALNLLGKEAPKKFIEKYNKEVHGKKVKVISRLEKLTALEIELNKEIEFIYSSIKNGGFMCDGAITIVESEDDAKVVSISVRTKLKETQDEIRRYLGEALELKMHTGDLRLDGTKPGIFINVPEYISHMCEKYQVEKPKNLGE